MRPPIRCVFAGTPPFAATSLQALTTVPELLCVKAALTAAPRRSGRGRKVHPSAVALAAVQHGIPVLQPERIDEAAQEQIRELQPDVLVVAAYGLILPRALLELPPLGCVNVHASLLPRWRGAAPIESAVLAGDARTGVTIMDMDEGVDTGNVLHALSTDVAPTDTLGTLTERLAVLGADALLQWIGGGGLLLEPHSRGLAQAQLPTQPTLARKVRKEHAKIAWDRPAAEIERQVRAFKPRPVAWTELGGEYVRVWSSELVASSGSGSAAAGTILAASEEGVDVSTGDGVLRLLELQAAGQRRGAALGVFKKSACTAGSVLL